MGSSVPRPLDEITIERHGEITVVVAAPALEKLPTEKYFPPIAGVLAGILILGLAAGYAKTFVLKKK